MWSQITLKTKIIKHRLIMCQCVKCGKKKWSNRRKKSNKVLSLIVINACIWLPIFDGLTSSQVMVFENTAVVPVAEASEIPNTDSPVTSGKAESSAVEVSSVADTLEVNQASPVQGSVIEEKIRKAFPGEEDTAVAIAMCESRLDPMRIGDTDFHKPSIGLFQINQHYHPYSTKELQNADRNIAIAKNIKERWGNWNAWSCYKFGFYEKYL